MRDQSMPEPENAGNFVDSFQRPLDFVGENVTGERHVTVMNVDHNRVRVGNDAAEVRAHAREKRFIRRLFPIEQLTTLRHYPAEPMPEVARSRVCRAT